MFGCIYDNKNINKDGLSGLFLIFVCSVVAIFDLVHDVEAIDGIC